MNTKFVHDFIVLENTALNSTNYLLKLKINQHLPELSPGQFVNIDIKNSDEIFLRRPFSIFEVDYVNSTISIIVKILGRGSKKLTEINVNDKLNIIYPLGKSFTSPNSSDKILLIGGGSGVAPMLFLAKESGLNKENVEILLGAKSREEHINVDYYNKFGNLHFATEDGTLGEKGFVTHHSAFRNLNKYDKIYACGPVGMMKAVANEAKIKNVFCEVSLENLMACGFGVCLCCIEPTVNGNLCVCKDGPVFNINDLKW